jgi:proteasome lid subunit RPN8/RPN11
VLTPDTGQRRLRLTRPCRDAMIAHATSTFPDEAVGLLGGIGGDVRRHVALPNMFCGKRFLADPFAQFTALRQFATEGLEPLAVYHSHPRGGVTLSHLDLHFANRLPYLQLVIAIGRTHTSDVEIAAYAVDQDGATAVTLEVIEDGEADDDDKAGESGARGGARSQHRDAT